MMWVMMMVSVQRFFANNYYCWIKLKGRGVEEKERERERKDQSNFRFRKLMIFHFPIFICFRLSVLWHDASLIVCYYFSQKNKILGVFYSLFLFFIFLCRCVTVSEIHWHSDTVITQVHIYFSLFSVVALIHCKKSQLLLVKQAP